MNSNIPTGIANAPLSLSFSLSLSLSSRKGCFKIVPVLVGALSHEREAAYGKIFSQYLNDPSNLFIISSDFCHWGQ